MSPRSDVDRATAPAQAVLGWLRAHAPAGAGLTLDSRGVVRGDVFLAYPGARSDGRAHAAQAVERGAAAVVFEADASGAVANAVGALGVPSLAVAGLKGMLGELASAWYGEPSAGMTVIAVTGTNGKTSCTQWLADILSAQGMPCGVVGTLGVRLPATGAGRAHADTGLTTPDAVSLHRHLAAMRDAGAVAVAIEASSIGIAEGRLDGVHVDIAAFANLSRDHLDYHGDMAAYEAEKARLFGWPGLRAAVLNLDDEAGRRLLASLRGGPLALAGFSLAGDVPPADGAACVLRADGLHATSQGMVFALSNGAAAIQVATPLLGAHNVANLLLVGGVLTQLGWPLTRVAAALSTAQAAPGRLEAVGRRPGEHAADGLPLVVVDYAHSPDALARALQALEPVARARGGRRICVFGCGGDRDAGKRPDMGRIAAAHADRVIVTSDNPRSEAPDAIIAQILAGVPADAPVQVEPDRAAAIRLAVRGAEPADVILLAGKGHEAYQDIAGVRQPFDDAEQARAALAAYPRPPAPAGMWSLGEAARAMRGVLHGDAVDPRQRFAHVGTDTRRVAPGELFVALRGERFDGHDYAADAVRAGAVAVVVERPQDGLAAPQIVVPDTRAALGWLAAAWRARFALPLIGVTGSNGKTTTKEMIAAILAAWQGEAHRLATRGNLNNDIGVPLTLLGLGPMHRCAVIELGMNHPGEIAWLAQIAAPTVGLVNNAQREHQEFMHTVEAVARENGAVIEALPPDGVAVYPADDPHTPIWDALAGSRRRLCFGLDGQGGESVRPADIRAVDVRCHAFDTHFVLLTPQGTADIVLAAAGLHNVRNALAAAACAQAAGVPLAAIAEGLRRFAPVHGRMQRHGCADGSLLIDDSYNANPDSVRAAIDVLATLPAPRVLVLGDMGEVGDDGPAMHREVGAYARARGIDALFTLGAAAREAGAAFGGTGHHAEHWEGIAPAVQALAPAAVLVKGSRFMKMERVVAALAAGERPSPIQSDGTTHAS